MPPNPWCAQPKLPSVRGFSNSTNQITSVPNTISANDPRSVSVAWINQRANTSLSTGKPSPPTTMASISGPSPQASLT